MKTAVLSMDVEDWYHLDYFDRQKCNESVSMLDGFRKYRELLNHHDIMTTFFVLGELANGSIREELIESKRAGHEIANHGWNHRRPLQMSLKAFRDDLGRSKSAIEDSLQTEVAGYRAPCFSMDLERLEIVRESGHLYDSSCIHCVGHPLYGNLDLRSFQEIRKSIFNRNGFLEFEVSSSQIFGRDVPVSGGGYLRIFPWIFMKWLLLKYLKKHDFFVLYIHPFELSQEPAPIFPNNTKWMTRRRFSTGRKNMVAKLDKLIELLKGNGFSFTTFSALQSKLLKTNANLED